MNRSFALTVEAEANLIEIWEYLAIDRSIETADANITAIYDECQKLGEMPGIGHYRQELLDQTYKFWRAGPYMIVYRWQVQPIDVIAVVHGARDLQAFFGDRS
ncbi:MAG TPA: type II toxin-antitoxin system RelE/ParE family toxin [Tepidisphaeraceae bacterium]|nr:type II toxin-antitoxin system RelE/ParE family toxin [Tepidisphaeraceae bacterium]